MTLSTQILRSDPRVAEILKARFGHDGFLPLQQDVIDNVLAGGDSIVLMPTGSGKSLCYQLPALSARWSHVGCLATDRLDEKPGRFALTAKGVRAAFVNGTMSYAEILNVQKEARSGRIDILYVSPERLAVDRFREFLRTLKIGLIAIDEAHCISEWGHDFRPDYRNLRTLRDEFPNAPVMALTATATEKVREDVAEQMDMVDAPRFVTSFNRTNLTYRVRPKRRSFDTLVQLLRTSPGPTSHHLLLLPEGYGGTGEGPLAPRFQGVALPRRSPGRCPPGDPGPLPQRRRTHHRGNHCFWDGHR